MELSLIKSVVREIQRLLLSKDVILIAIDGVGGSGKTYFTKVLQKEVANCTIFQLDDFYSPRLQTADILRLKEQVLLPLLNNKVAKYQIYEWKIDQLSDWNYLKPEGIIVFEGVYALDKQIRKYFDIKIWIEYSAELGFKRGVERDIKSYGVDNSDKWKNIWMPLEERYVNEQNPRNSADYVINADDEIS